MRMKISFVNPLESNHIDDHSMSFKICSYLFPLVSGRKHTTKIPPISEHIANSSMVPCIPKFSMKAERSYKKSED